MTRTADVIRYVSSWRSAHGIAEGGILSEQQLSDFAKGLAEKVGELSVKPPVEGADLILYDE